MNGSIHEAHEAHEAHECGYRVGSGRGPGQGKCEWQCRG